MINAGQTTQSDPVSQLLTIIKCLINFKKGLKDVR